VRKEHWKAFEHTAVTKISKYRRVYYGNGEEYMGQNTIIKNCITIVTIRMKW
jgi:hypothetical protein